MELLRALAALTYPPGAELEPVARALDLPPLPTASAHYDLFGFQLYPYASVQLGSEGMLGGEARDRVGGFWRALGLNPPAEPDHLAGLLGLYASLADQESAGIGPARRARAALAWEHLLPWLPIYLDRVQELAPGFYAAWAKLLAEALASSCSEVEMPTQLPLHLRAAAPPPNPASEGYEAFLDALLAPVRSGLVLTRADLARCGRAIGTGSRSGGRRLILAGLVAQDGQATWGWLAREAKRWEVRHTRLESPSPIAAFWSERAGLTAARCLELAHGLKGSKARRPVVAGN